MLTFFLGSSFSWRIPPGDGVSYQRLFFLFVTRASPTVSKTMSLFDSSALSFLFLMLTLNKQRLPARKLKRYEEEINTAKTVVACERASLNGFLEKKMRKPFH